MMLEWQFSQAEAGHLCGFGRDNSEGGCLRAARYRIETHDQTTGHDEVRYGCRQHVRALIAPMGWRLPPDPQTG
jgi:hypothetical protein